MVRAPVVKPAHPGAPTVSDLAKYQAALDAAPNLSAASKDQYKQQLKRLTETVGHEVEWILANAKPAMRLLLDAERTDGKRMMDAPMTIKAMIDALVALLRHVPGLSERYPGARDAWDKLYSHASARANDRYENNEATERHRADFVPWPEILAKRDGLLARMHAVPGHMDSVVAALHTMIAPARSDYGDVRVYHPPLDPVPSKPSPNHVVWTTTGGQSINNNSIHTMHLVLDEFKTRLKKNSAHEADLPPDLVALLARSFAARPRRHLVVSPESGKPYANPGAYAKYVTRVFTALLGKHTTINSLRHSFSSQLDFNTLTPKQRREIADSLMHSPEMTHRYRYVNVSPSVPEVTCELVCKKKTTPAKKAATKAAAADLLARRMAEQSLI
jgi:hypothetical protein